MFIFLVSEPKWMIFWMIFSVLRWWGIAVESRVALGCIPHTVICCKGLQGCASDSRLIYVFSIIFLCGCSCQVHTVLFSWEANKLCAIFLHQDFTHCNKLSQIKGLLLSSCLGNTFQDPSYRAFPQATEAPGSAYFVFLYSDLVNLVIPILFVFSSLIFLNWFVILCFLISFVEVVLTQSVTRLDQEGPLKLACIPNKELCCFYRNWFRCCFLLVSFCNTIWGCKMSLGVFLMCFLSSGCLQGCQQCACSASFPLLRLPAGRLPPLKGCSFRFLI